MIHTVKGFSAVNETEIDVFLKFPCFLYNPPNVGNLISSSSSFSKPTLDIWNFLVHVMLKPSMQDFKHDLTSMGDECDCPMVSTFFGTTLLGNWDKERPFPGLWSLLGLPDLLTPTKVRLFKAMVFLVVMYGCESWTVKKAEC